MDIRRVWAHRANGRPITMRSTSLQSLQVCSGLSLHLCTPNNLNHSLSTQTARRPPTVWFVTARVHPREMKETTKPDTAISTETESGRLVTTLPTTRKNVSGAGVESRTILVDKGDAMTVSMTKTTYARTTIARKRSRSWFNLLFQQVLNTVQAEA